MTIIGSGKMMPTKERHPSCYLLEVGDRRILLDIGHTSLARLVDLGIDLQKIDTVFISHFHTDHFADFLPFVHSRWFDDLSRPGQKQSPLTVIGPESIKKRFSNLRKVFWVEPNEHYDIDFLEGERKLTIGDIKIELFEVKHVEWFQSLGIKITYQGKTFVYTGDIGSRHSLGALTKKVKNADLLLIESGYLKPVPNHFSIDQVIDVSSRAKVKKTIATHINQRRIPLFKEKVKNQSNVVIGCDLKKFKI